MVVCSHPPPLFVSTGFLSSKPTELTECDCPWVYVFPFQDLSTEGMESHTPFPMAQLLQEFTVAGAGVGWELLEQCNWAKGAQSCGERWSRGEPCGLGDPSTTCVFYRTLPGLFHLTRVLFFFFLPLIPDMMTLGEELGTIAQIILGHVKP